MKELGSEYWKEPTQYIPDNAETYLSGRTALDIIIKDAVESYSITSALLPSYSCHTMIEPFISNNISIRFYDVYVDETGKLTADVPTPGQNEILYLVKYFGDTDLKYTGEGKNLDGWCTTVEDLTHSCFDHSYATQAEYWFSSYRKWFAADGIAVAGKRGEGLRPARKAKNAAYCRLRNTAFAMKDQFMADLPVKKQDFLNKFSEAEQLLSKDYCEYGASPDTVSNLVSFFKHIDIVREKRRENATVLVDGLSDISGIQTFVDLRDPSKCPLFVPIMVGDGRRNALQQHLIERKIYCPIHWPLSQYHAGLSERALEIYQSELSLVCDQRYSAMDMRHVLDVLYMFFR